MRGENTMKITDLKIGVRLGLLAGLFLLAVVTVGFEGWLTLSQSNARAANALENASRMTAMVDAARDAQVHFKIQVQEWKNTLLRGNDPANFDKYRQAFEKEGEATRTRLQKLEAMLAKSSLDTALASDTQKALTELQAKYLEALKQYDTSNKDSAQVVDALVKGMDRAPTKKIDEIVAFVMEQSNKMAADATAEAAASHKAANMLLLTVILLAIALGGSATYWLIRSIIKPLGIAVHVARTVAAGDLTSRIDASSKDETGQLMEALRDMNDNLARIVAEIRASTEAITDASNQLAHGNLDLSSRTEEQASSLEETASAMEQLTSTVKQNGDNAHQANSLATSASQVAAKGGTVVSNVVQTMGSINESSKKIVDIIGVIDGIAFQTNILALNAAVEAARAGEQGRGFAVVASEVRNLAQRSAAAAKEIKVLINDSVSKVENGSAQVHAAGATMQEIVDSVQRFASIMADITAASQEQTTGIEQINLAIARMDETTQQNSSLVEEAAAASDAMRTQATNLSKAVSVFKLAEA